ncbi:MAG: flagellar assembly protein FliW [Clostridiales bacterium]|nr:flagellar assembly protein FliW [Clostridiales bacterium]
MRLHTKHFGDIDVDDGKVIEFKEGLPGFPKLTKFVLLADERGTGGEMNGMFYWLQSVENPDTAFVLVNMVRYMPEYNPLVEEDQMEGLGEFNPDKFVIYNIAVIPDNVREATVNLKAPVVINDENHQGKQVICSNDEYTVRHFMFK